MTGQDLLTGRRVLVVEDQFIIAIELERMLRQAGCLVTAAARLKAALELAREGDFDFAVLDVNLFGEKVFPVADMLESRAIPFVLTTGYGEAAVPEGRTGWRVISKPYDAAAVVELISTVLAA